LSTPNSAMPAARSRFHLPSNTKYSNVKLERAATDVAVESIELAHEGFLPTSTGAGRQLSTGRPASTRSIRPLPRR
jgi:hypothetical protein